MPESLRQHFVRARGWLIPAVLLALAPKCVLCLLAYAGLAAVLGLGGPEICGAVGDPTGHQAIWLVASGVAMGIATVRLIGRSHRSGSSRRCNDQTQS